ncbi:MAG: DUF4397 domain-containing protein [Sphingobacteriales bacterium]|nr:MAG: DUF4397 domain-containing protein [Sphingobacteriales bacterium]
MKKIFNLPARYSASLLLIGAAVFALSSCSKDEGITPRQPAAGLMAFNLAPDKPSVGFTLSGAQLTSSGLPYTGYTGQYLAVAPGSRQLASYDAAAGTPILTSTHIFKDSSYNSAFLIGANGFYRHVVTEDRLDTLRPVSGKAWVRYINAIADTTLRPNVTINGNTEGAVFGTISNFEPVNAGNLAASISVENTSRTITVEENKVYTILFVGITNQTNTALAPQVKFIVNGTVTN